MSAGNGLCLCPDIRDHGIKNANGQVRGIYPVGIRRFLPESGIGVGVGNESPGVLLNEEKAFHIMIFPAGPGHVAGDHHGVPAFGPVFIGQYKFKGPVIPYFPDISLSAPVLSCNREFMEILGEPSCVTDSDPRFLLPRIEENPRRVR